MAEADLREDAGLESRAVVNCIFTFKWEVEWVYILLHGPRDWPKPAPGGTCPKLVHATD